MTNLQKIIQTKNDLDCIQDIINVYYKSKNIQERPIKQAIFSFMNYSNILHTCHIDNMMARFDQFIIATISEQLDIHFAYEYTMINGESAEDAVIIANQTEDFCKFYNDDARDQELQEQGR
jgi:hypothetical protein